MRDSDGSRKEKICDAKMRARERENGGCEKDGSE